MGTAGISVALATYNGERFLQAQLDSLAAQELRPVELVACDDCSTDATVKILTDFAAAAPFPVQIHVNESNLGWRANFMQAAGLSRAGLIAFCDQDDVWYPHKLRIMSDLMDDPVVLLGHHDTHLIDAAGTLAGRLRAHDRDMLRRPPLTRPINWESPLGLTMVFRRSLLAFSGYWPLSIDPANLAMPMAHDQWFFTLASCFGTVAYTPDTLLGYRQHGGNVVGFDSDARSGASGATHRVATRLAGEAATVAAFCDVLERAGADEHMEFGSSVPVVLDRCQILRGRLALRSQIRGRDSIAGRLGAFAKLCACRSYSRRVPWSLGYRELIADLRVVAAGTKETK